MKCTASKNMGKKTKKTKNPTAEKCIYKHARKYTNYRASSVTMNKKQAFSDG